VLDKLMTMVVWWQVPEVLMASRPLVFNMTTLAGIFLGTITSWNDPAIRELNPTVADLLPAESIIVVVSNRVPAQMHMVSQVLSEASTAFRDQVHTPITPDVATEDAAGADVGVR
jgi:phosphate transport system substrate-binding protein